MKIAIYTAMIGGYDNINQPLVSDTRYDFILFTDNPSFDNYGVWKTYRLDYKNDDPTKTARYVKTHPHILLPDYDATIWIDANISILTPELYIRGLKLFYEGVKIAGIMHPIRDCIYDEAFSILANGLENEKTVIKWCHYLRSVNYPRHVGLNETNVLFRRNDSVVNRMNDQWWNFIETFSRRDQLSFNYACYKTNLPQKYIFGEDEHCRNSKNIAVYKHRQNANKKGRRGVSIGFMAYLRNRCRAGFTEGDNHFKKFHYWLYGRNDIFARLIVRFWGIYALLFWGIYAKYKINKKTNGIKKD